MKLSSLLFLLIVFVGCSSALLNQTSTASVLTKNVQDTLQQEPQDPCSKIEVKSDPYESITTYRTPFDLNIHISLIKRDSISSLILSFVTYGITAVYYGGIYVLFDSGEVWKEEDGYSDVDYVSGTYGRYYSSPGKYRYYGSMELSDEKLLYLTTHKIVGYKIRFYEQKVDLKISNAIMAYANCFLKIKN